MKNAAFFPHRLYRWFLSQQLGFSAILFALAAIWLLVWINNSGYDKATISAGRIIIGLCLFSGLLIFVLVSLVTTRRLVIPLGRLIDKTRHLREFPFEGEGGPAEELTYDEPGEWFELERALNNLGRDLRSKTVRLSREKTEFRAIVTAVTEAVLAITKEKRLLFYNPQFAQLFDMQHVGGDTRIAEVLRSPDVLETYREALETGHPIRREVQIILPDERIPHHFQLSVAPLKKKHNQEVYGAVGIFHDITELVRADKIRIEFVGNVSHEIRTPLTTINGYMQTLVSDFEKGRFDQAGEFLGVVNQNVKRLKSLLDDLLDLSAIESGKDLHLENLNVMEITEGALKQVRHADHEIHVRHDFETLHADPKRIEQVLRNLLENAVRYVPKGGRIDVLWSLNADGKPELRVKDNGPGIASEHQSRLFERFYRVDEARSRETGGTGIGLSLVKHIMQRHGGRVYVQSQVGQGAEFVCEFQAPNLPLR